jgi:hypothetical protein
MRRILISAFIAGIAACNCALAGDQDKSAEKLPIVASDEQTVEVRGISHVDRPFGNTLDGGAYQEWFIRSFVDKHTHVARHQLYVHVIYSPGYYGDKFQTARTDDGDPLAIAFNDRRLGPCYGGDCQILATVGVELSETLLRDRAQTGFQVKIVARGGSNGLPEQLDLFVSPEMIQKQLAALAEAEKLP